MIQTLEKKNTRVVGFDLIRIIACFFVLLVHFNAQVCGYENGQLVYPNSIIPGIFFGGRIYLGTLGVVMFFILSGASLTMTHRPGESIFKFYIRRFLSIFPPFWIAFLLATAFDFLYFRGISIAAPWKFIISFAGLDGYFSSLNLIPCDYYKLGEWFLGCIILIYAIFPLIHWLMEKSPKAMCYSTAAVILLGLLCVRWKVPALKTSTSFLLCLGEVMLGMLYQRFSLHQHKGKCLWISTSIFVISLIISNYISAELLNLVTGCFLFCLLMVASELIKSPSVGTLLQSLSAQTFSVFLVHHWLIFRMIQGFDRSNLPRMYVVILFIIYLGLTCILSVLLTKAGSAFSGMLRKNLVVTKLLLILVALSIVFSCCCVFMHNIGKIHKIFNPEVLSAEFISSEVRDDTLYLNVSNTGNVPWKSGESICCALFVDGGDSGIRSMLEPDQTVNPENTAVFVFPLELVPAQGIIEAVMLQEGVTYFGDYFTIDR